MGPTLQHFQTLECVGSDTRPAGHPETIVKYHAATPACDPQPHLGQVPVVTVTTALRNAGVLGEVGAPIEAQSSRFVQLTSLV
ncbi:hypothetical protein SRHO_G00076020 [Serrasalmus rhombeus]